MSETTTDTESRPPEAGREPGVMEQIASAVPDHAYSERRPFHWQIRWSRKSGVWTAECSAFQPVSITGPGFRFKPASGAQAVEVLRAVGAIDPEPVSCDEADSVTETWSIVWTDPWHILLRSPNAPDAARGLSDGQPADAGCPGEELWAKEFRTLATAEERMRQAVAAQPPYVATFARRVPGAVVGFDPAYRPADPPAGEVDLSEAPSKES